MSVLLDSVHETLIEWRDRQQLKPLNVIVPINTSDDQVAELEALGFKVYRPDEERL